MQMHPYGCFSEEIIFCIPISSSFYHHRFDHAPFFSMQKSEYTIPFYVKEDKSKAAAAEKKSWVNKSFHDLFFV